LQRKSGSRAPPLPINPALTPEKLEFPTLTIPVTLSSFGLFFKAAKRSGIALIPATYPFLFDQHSAQETT
jgi:hypothetical protein